MSWHTGGGSHVAVRSSGPTDSRLWSELTGEHIVAQVLNIWVGKAYNIATEEHVALADNERVKLAVIGRWSHFESDNSDGVCRLYFDPTMPDNWKNILPDFNQGKYWGNTFA